MLFRSVIEQAAIRWAQHLPNARVMLLNPPYLFPWVRDAARFDAAVDQFLGGQWPERAVKPPPFDPTGGAPVDSTRPKA